MQRGEKERWIFFFALLKVFNLLMLIEEIIAATKVWSTKLQRECKRIYTLVAMNEVITVTQFAWSSRWLALFELFKMLHEKAWKTCDSYHSDRSFCNKDIQIYFINTRFDISLTQCICHKSIVAKDLILSQNFGDKIFSISTSMPSMNSDWIVEKYVLLT